MDIVSMMHIVLNVPNPMIGESALPDFTSAANQTPEGVGVSALDQLNRVFEGYLGRRSQQEMNMLRHDNECMDFKSAFTAISIHRLQEESDVIFNNEEPSALPCCEGNEISSGRRNQSSRLQEQTSAAKAATFA